MKDLVLNDLTERQITDFIQHPAHALLLEGAAGSGKSTLATLIAAEVLGVSELENYAYKLIIDQTGTIGIDEIRQFEHFLSLRVPRKAGYNRVAIINGADSLTLEAQNALLKTLEEPPAGTLIILTASHSQALLPTIRSRCRTLSVKRSSKGQLEQYFKDQGFKAAEIERAYAISGGLPGLMKALLQQADHPLLQATEKARELLKGSAYERLGMVDELAKQKVLALDTVFILQQMARVSLRSAQTGSSARWQRVLPAAHDASLALELNVQAKLVLTKLALSL